MRLGRETGSLTNYLMNAPIVSPEVGMGATILGWTDRHPATITKVTPKTISVKEDRAERIDNNGM